MSECSYSIQTAVDARLHTPFLRVDPLSRCAGLSLPSDSIAILPFYQTQAELDIMEQEQKTRCVSLISASRVNVPDGWPRDVPYSPSFVLNLTSDVDERIRHIIDFVFLPGFNNPTIAVLFQQPQTWTGCVVS